LAFTSLFFDKRWGKENLECEPPDSVVAGTGLPLGIVEGTGLGYAIKFDIKSSCEDWTIVSFSEDLWDIFELLGIESKYKAFRSEMLSLQYVDVY
jgi:hypothetical protein